MKKFFITIFIFSSFYFLASSSLALAQTEELKNAKQGVVDSVSALSDIQNNEDLTDAEQAAQEAEARKIALEKIFELSLLEIKTLSQKVAAVKDLAVEYIELQNQLLKKLSGLAGSIKEYDDRLQEIDSLEAVKNLAAEFKDWRVANYDPVIQNALDFISVFQSQTFLRVAEARYERIANDLRRLRFSKIVKIETLEPLLNWAGQDLKEARAAFNQALVLLLETKPDKPSIGKLVESMVNDIKDAYKKFFEMSDLVRKMVKPS